MSDAAQLLGPTRHRLQHANGNDVLTPLIDQQTVRRNWRIVAPVETMHRQRKITDGMWLAWMTFEADWETAAIEPSIVAKYGDRAAGGGTPVNQLRHWLFEEVQERDRERREALQRVRGALLAIGIPRLQHALLLAVASDTGLEGIGKRISRYGDRGKAIAIAGAALEDVLWLLEHHYSRLYGQSQVAP